MRLLILSDLHREIYPNRDLGIDLEVSKPDVVILAGDIDKGQSSVKWAAEVFAGLPVLYIAGNHEFYGFAIDRVPDAIKQACDETKNVHFMNQDEFIFQGVRFLGATMWTDFELFGNAKKMQAMDECRRSMNDYHLIHVAKDDYRKLDPADTARLNFVQTDWLRRELTHSAHKTVVISHHAPGMYSVPDAYKADIVSAAYASDLEELAVRADLWIHGHTHTSMDYQIEKCRVVCNPCGYVRRSGGNENANFNPNFIVEI